MMAIWEFPQTILGATLSRFFPKAFDYQECSVHYNKGNWGLSLGRYIFIPFGSTRYSRLFLHEYGHSRQSRILGPLYLIVVGIPSLLRFWVWAVLRLTLRSYYQGFPERWADKLGGVTDR